jgi:hypothetical protein
MSPSAVRVMNPVHKFESFQTIRPGSRLCIENLCYSPNVIKSRDSSVGIALGYGLEDRGSRVRFAAGDGNFSLHHRVQNGSGAHPAFYPMGTRGSFPGGKAAGAWSYTSTPQYVFKVWCLVKHSGLRGFQLVTLVLLISEDRYPGHLFVDSPQ